MGQHVVRVDDVRGAVAGPQIAGQALAEKFAHRADPALRRDLGDVTGRLDAQHWNPSGDVVLQEIAVVARDLKDQARGAEPALAREPRRQLACVADHRVGIGGKVDVIAEQRLGRHGFGDLHQRAARAPGEI